MGDSAIESFNPYFTGLPILIEFDAKDLIEVGSFNPYFTGLPILINRKIW